MSVHKSLRTGGSLVKHRNVLTRTERVKFLEEAGEWREGQSSVLGLRKVKSIKMAAKKKVKKEVAAEGVGAAPASGAAAPGAAPAAGAAAKPTAGAAAPAAAAAKPAAKK